MLYNVFMVASSTSIGDERGRASSKSSCRAICKGQHDDGVDLCLLFCLCVLLTDSQYQPGTGSIGVQCTIPYFYIGVPTYVKYVRYVPGTYWEYLTVRRST